MATEALRTTVRGDVLRPGDDGYDDARSVWNARFDRRPDVVVRCVDADDVVEAVRWARESGLEVSVRGGGHAYAGNTVADGGLLVDLSRMAGVKVQPEQRRVSVQGGATWADVDAATQHHGMATPGVTVSSVGVAGSTLGAGTGWLSRAFGHAVDNLLAVELVTADGRRVRVDGDTDPELFWGLRGAGPNFGIATSLDLRLHDVGPEVLAGQVVYPFDDAEELLRGFRAFMEVAPAAFQCLPFAFRVPPIEAFPEAYHGHPVLDFVIFHLDPGATDAVQALRELGTPILDAVGPMAYTAAQQAFDPNLPSGQRYYSTAHDLAELSDAAIADFVTHVREMTGEFSVAYLEPRGGRAARVPASSTAVGGRNAPIAFHVIAGWVDAARDEDVMGWARDFGRAMSHHATGGVYVNLLGDDEAARVPSAFSDTDRLRRLKAHWDPDNVLRGNHNVTPAGAPGDVGVSG